MSIIANLLGMRPIQAQAEVQTMTTLIDGWPFLNADSVSGVSVSPETALKVSTFYACVGLISETIASLPLIIYRLLDNDAGRERARNHPIYDLLRRQPNERQTSFEFVQMLTVHALMRGSGYARIRSGPRGFVDSLEPIHPDLIRKEELKNGRIRYRVTEVTGGRPTVYNQEDIFEVGGMSLDGLNTISVIQYARDSLGLTLAAERYGARFYRNDSRPGGILHTDKRLSPDAQKKLKTQWQAAHTASNQHKVAVLEEGVAWQQIGISPEEAQFLATREFQAEDVCRWLRVPPHMVGLTSKATSWGSGIEEMSSGFVTYTLRPWLTRWEQSVSRDLLLAPDRYFAAFVVEALLRGNIKDRYDAYAIARNWGWLSVNDIRRKENENPIPGGDTYLQPLNMSPAAREFSPVVGETAVSPHYRMLAEEAAGRLVRKELAAMTRAWERAAGDQESWETAVSEFYASHAHLVAQTMRIPLDQAAIYCSTQETDLIDHGIKATSGWDTTCAINLAKFAIGETNE